MAAGEWFKRAAFSVGASAWPTETIRSLSVILAFFISSIRPPVIRANASSARPAAFCMRARSSLNPRMSAASAAMPPAARISGKST